MSQVLEVPYPGGPVPLRAIRSAQRGGLGTRECAGEVGVGARVGATKKLPRYRATYLRWPSCPPARPPAPGRSSTRLWPARIPYQRYEYLRCAARHPSALRRRSPPPPKPANNQAPAPDTTPNWAKPPSHTTAPPQPLISPPLLLPPSLRLSTPNPSVNSLARRRASLTLAAQLPPSLAADHFDLSSSAPARLESSRVSSRPFCRPSPGATQRSR